MLLILKGPLTFAITKTRTLSTWVWERVPTGQSVASTRETVSGFTKTPFFRVYCTDGLSGVLFK